MKNASQMPESRLTERDSVKEKLLNAHSSVSFSGFGTCTLTTAQQREKRFRKRPVASPKGLVRKNNWSQDQATKKSSYKEHRVDALAPYAEEGRGKLRKATGSRKQAPIRRHPNGGTRQVKNLSP